MGIEIEAEGVYSDVFSWLSCGHWTTTHDSSVKDNGKEFISPPGSPAYLRTLLAQLYTMFELAKSMPKFTWRTSTHVHVNMRDRSPRQICHFLILYALFENELFGFLDPSRRHSHFTVPILDTHYYLNISKTLHGGSFAGNIVKSWHKYSAINTRPLMVNDHLNHGMNLEGGKGTVEFRSMEGTSDPSKIIDWMNLLSQLYHASGSFKSNKGLLHFVLQARSPGAWKSMLHAIFGKYADDRFIFSVSKAF